MNAMFRPLVSSTLHRCPLQYRARPRLRSPPAARPQTRPASSPPTAGPDAEWLVVIPDAIDARKIRLAVRAQHIQDLRQRIDSGGGGGGWQLGGGLLEKPDTSPDVGDWTFYGSAFVMRARSREDVVAVLRQDIYAQAGVWDMDKVQIWPFKCMFRKHYP